MLMLHGNMPFIGDVVVTLLIIVQIIFLSRSSATRRSIGSIFEQPCNCLGQFSSGAIGH
jgi:hypothetical protein